MKNTWENALRNLLIAEKICLVDRSDSNYIHNPYASSPTAVVQAKVGTYATAAWTVTDDSLTVVDEIYVAEHIYDFEAVTAQFDLFANRMDNMMYSVAAKLDYYVLNGLCEAATGTLDTPSGGFTTAANWPIILSNIISQSAGYADIYNGYFLVVENTDIVGIVQSQFNTGYSFADAALRNGLLTSQGGVDIYVVRSGTFADATIGTLGAVTNSGHRVAGVKNMATYASPRGLQYEEKSVSAKTGKEVVAMALVGFKLWTPKAGLVIDITIV